MSVESRSRPDPRQLPHLLNLLDDENLEVQSAIIRHLVSFGPTLKTELSKLSPELVQSRTLALEKILLEHDREVLLQKWPSWDDPLLDLEKLEKALSLLANFQSGLKFRYMSQTIGELLDGLAREYLVWSQQNTPLELAGFLFTVQGFSGAKTDYYNPQCSNLLYVLNEKRGLPISLSCVYMLVGARLGFAIEGYNAPGHFMAKIVMKGKIFLVDCFNGGKIISEGDVVRLAEMGTAPEDNIPAPAPALHIVRRVLNNLINAYQSQGESGHQQLMIDLYRAIQDP